MFYSRSWMISYCILFIKYSCFIAMQARKIGAWKKNIYLKEIGFTIYLTLWSAKYVNKTTIISCQILVSIEKIYHQNILSRKPFLLGLSSIRKWTFLAPTFAKQPNEFKKSIKNYSDTNEPSKKDSPLRIFWVLILLEKPVHKESWNLTQTVLSRVKMSLLMLVSKEYYY